MPAPDTRRMAAVAIDKYHAPGIFGALAPRQFHVMAKPAGSACNLNCTYCFYLGKQHLPGGPGGGHMGDEVLERFVRNYIESVTTDEVVFSWQGGEPTLLGIDFFRKVVALQQQFRKPGQRIENDLQTNGTLLDDEWADFLKRHRFLVGLSIDGPRDVHDECRVSKQRKPTFDDVMRAARALQRAAVPFSTLTCVHRYNASRPLDVYRFLRRELGATRLQFIPIVEIREFETVAPQEWRRENLPVVGSVASRPGHADSIVTPWSVDPDDYGRFLCKVWDEWLARDAGKVFVDFCAALVGRRMGLAEQSCVKAEMCGKAVVLEHDGSVYACDHFVYPSRRLGSVLQQSLADLVFSPAQVRFGYAKSESLPAYCHACEFLPDCWGECPRTRCVRAPDGEAGLSYLCPGLKQFFRHASAAADRIARQAAGRR